MMKKMSYDEAKATHEFVYWPLVYRYTEELALACNASGTEISSQVLEDALCTVFADESLARRLVNAAYRAMGYQMAYCNPLQLFISAPQIVTDPLAQQGKSAAALICDCLFETAKICASLGFFVPGRQKT